MSNSTTTSAATAIDEGGAIRRLVLVAGGFLVLLAGAAYVRFHLAPVREPPPVYGEVFDFALIERSGRPVGRADLAGKVWVADFIFTRCAGQCPLMTSRMMAVRDAVPARAEVRLVSITVDPEHDTPERLRAHAKGLGIEGEEWLWLTGERPAIYRFAREGMKLAAEPGGGPDQEEFLHSPMLVLVDRAGRIRGYYDANDEAAQARLVADLRAVVREPNR